MWVPKIHCIGNENVYHILELKTEDDEDKAAPYMKFQCSQKRKLRLSNEKACWEQTLKTALTIW